MNYLGLLFNLPALLGLVSEVQSIFKTGGATEANIDKLVLDAKPIVEKFFPQFPPAEVDAIAADIVALVSLGANHTLDNAEIVAATIVKSLPSIFPGLALTQEHDDALVQALSDAIGDFKRTSNVQVAPTVATP